MRPENDIKRFIDKAAVSTNPKTDKAVLDTVLTAHGKTTDKTSAKVRPSMRSIVMKNPITKFAAAAVIIGTVVLGIFEFPGTGSSFGVAWAQVARKVEASRGLIFRSKPTGSDSDNSGLDYSMDYLSGNHRRTDIYKAGQITVSHYLDFDAKLGSSVWYTRKSYWRDAPLSEQDLKRQQNLMNPKSLIQAILSCQHRALGRKTIDGVLCEGLETTDPAVFGDHPPVNTLDVRLQLWVSVETGYPVLAEYEVNAVSPGGQKIHTSAIIDQMQWDVTLDASVFEPNIPSGYTEM